MTRHSILALAVSLAAVVAISSLAAGAQETLLYGGDVKDAPASVVLGSWGSGGLEEVTAVKFQGGKSLRLISQGGFQGGRIDFSTPLDISGYAGQPNAYLEIWVRPHFARPKPKAAAGVAPAGQVSAAEAQQRRRVPVFRSRSARDEDEDDEDESPRVRPRPGTTAARSGRAGRTTPGYTPPGATTRRPSGSTATRARTTRTEPEPQAKPAAPTAPAAPTGPAPADQAAFRTDGFRIQLRTDQGTAVLAGYPIYPGDKSAGGWVRVGFPLSEFEGLIGDELHRLVIFSERSDILYIGQAKIRLETAAIQVSPAAYPAIARVGQPVTFVANAQAGLTPFEAVWDFDNSDDITEQATGARVVNVYRQPGEYEAAVTVRDTTGAIAEAKTIALLVRVK